MSWAIVLLSCEKGTETTQERLSPGFRSKRYSIAAEAARWGSATLGLGGD